MSRKARADRVIAAMRFVWTPGIRPVNVPAMVPRRIAVKSWSIIFMGLVLYIDAF